MSIFSMMDLPGYKGLLNDAIRERVVFLAQSLNLMDLESRFPHLNIRDGSWRKHLENSEILDLSPFIDHTQLKPDADRISIENLCLEALTHQFAAVCVNGWRAALCHSLLTVNGKSKVRLACVCGFLLGQMTTAMKLAEAMEEMEHGANEIDMVLNVGALKDKNYIFVYDEICRMHQICEARNAHLKVILEISLLTETEIIDACIISVAARAHFVKTSTGFGTHGATPEAVDIMLAVVGNEALVKVSGGVRDRITALKYIETGVRRIGTSNGTSMVSLK